jgi:hypothetical protein
VWELVVRGLGLELVILVVGSLRGWLWVMVKELFILWVGLFERRLLGFIDVRSEEFKGVCGWD